MAFLKGLDNVLKNLNREIKAIEGRSLKGMGLAVMAIRNDMETTPPLVPIDTGNLRASWFAEPLSLPTGPAVIFGFSANYAAYVHELLGAHFQRPGAGPKFLQAHLRRTKERTLRIIADNARIPG
jgi:hypothetical protein